MARQRACHIVTLEDPIEYRFTAGQAVVHQREVGTHVASFAAGLRAALRESPDVLLVGEMRDPETIALALSAAETGHLVLSTLHSGTAAGAIERMVNASPEADRAAVRAQLAGCLRFVLTQQLLPAAAAAVSRRSRCWRSITRWRRRSATAAPSCWPPRLSWALTTG